MAFSKVNGLKTSIYRLTDGYQTGACGLAAFPLAAARFEAD